MVFERADRSRPSTRQIGAAFRNFAKLHTISVVGVRCTKFEETTASPTTRPPNLTTLNIRWRLGADHNPYYGDGPQDCETFHRWLRSIVAGLPNLANLRLTLDGTSRLRRLRPHPQERNLEAVEAELKASHVVFLLYVRSTNTSCFPPYLYGERENTDDLMYASDGRASEEGYARPATTMSESEEEESDEGSELEELEEEEE